MLSKSKIHLKLTKKQVLQSAQQILNEYTLCDRCTGRLFSKKLKLKSNVLLGKKIKKSLNIKTANKCYICKNILSNLNSYVDKMKNYAIDYQFDSFIVGAILKPSIIDRDDHIRSKFKLLGIDSIKTDITRQIDNIFAKKTRKKIDHLNPDITFMLNFKNDSCELKTKPIIFFGRYLKKNRGIHQKQKPCNECSGKGCLFCKYHGITQFSSIEGRLTEFFIKKLGISKAKITWIGGEDKQSLVLGNGRPFFIKLFEPHKRKLNIKKKSLKDGIGFRNLKNIEQIPNEPISFSSNVELLISTKKKISPSQLNILKSLTKTPITILDSRKKPSTKYIHKVNFKKLSENSFIVKMVADGGIPIKRLIEGSSISPNISELLKTQCTCKQFDFYNIFIR